jgi:hypothetical protein
LWCSFNGALLKAIRRKMNMKKINIGANPVTDEAIRLINKIYNALIHTQDYSLKAVNGRNKTIRDNSAMMSLHAITKTLQQLEPWNEIITAKVEGKDVHRAPLKSKKLEIVSGSQHNFAQYLIEMEDE